MSTAAWGNATQQEVAARRQTLNSHLRHFTSSLLEQVSSLPKPDYRIIEEGYVSIGWNLISRKVFVYQPWVWVAYPAMGSSDRDDIVGSIRQTMLLSISMNGEPGHVSQLVLAERTPPIIEGVRIDYSLAPIIAELRHVRNNWRPPEVQALYDPKTGRPIVNPISSLMHGLPEMPGAHELVMTPPRRYLVEEGELPWRT